MTAFEEAQQWVASDTPNDREFRLRIDRRGYFVSLVESVPDDAGVGYTITGHNRTKASRKTLESACAEALENWLRASAKLAGAEVF